jgi:multiple antibiotic resistance protein
MTLFSLALALFLIMDPFGNLATFIKLLKDLNTKEYVFAVLRELFIALVLMLIFNIAGDYLLQYLSLTPVTVYFASSVILFLTAFQILFPTAHSIRLNLPKDPPFIIPLAIPLIAGPSLLATIMLFAHEESSYSIMFLAIFLAWACALIVILFARKIKKFFGDNGLMAIERLTAMVLILIAIQRFLEGLHIFVESLT